jgi:hypothetical protein
MADNDKRRNNNLAGWNAARQSGHAYPLIDAQVEELERGLRLQLPAPTPVQVALIQAARGLYGSILLTQKHILAPHSKVKRLGNLYMNLPTLTSNFLRCLRSLGVVGIGVAADSDEDGPPADATPEQLREWSRRYVERRQAEAREAQP